MWKMRDGLLMPLQLNVKSNAREASESMFAKNKNKCLTDQDRCKETDIRPVCFDDI